ncbi:MAG: hypothetical protein RXQ56_07700 [Thermoproteus sp.]|jgi:hypothetical protein|uniref:hypothetical protein n=1 Tax=Thermoproteus sp. CP80 TaxID=1650659 RepID=UPI0007489DAC|nr:hypothetical protein [Thermoproteus sp. CP80]KUO84421.1 MAG: hypothetical protein AT711_00730 [Thermoproteus sp. CIS_19]PLC64198.1 hypothetical protein B7L68_04935 [Thermoproteus sp. CP80]
MSLAGVRFDYIHAERVASPPPNTPLQIQMNYQIEADRAVRRGGVLELPFALALTTNPSAVTLTIRGIAVVQGEVDLGNLPPHVAVPLMQMAMFEASLILRELGMPPLVYIQQGGGSQQQQQTRYF